MFACMPCVYCVFDCLLVCGRPKAGPEGPLPLLWLQECVPAEMAAS